MEMGESSFSEFYRNTSEEIFLKTLMEGSLGTPVPTMETLGLKNLTLNCRTDSEEIFKNWLTMGENGDIPLHHQQASRRISRELASLTGHHHLPNTLQRKRSNENLNPQPLPGAEEPAYDPSDPNQNSTRNMAEREIQASNLFLAKEWFQSSKPMTRSRSSELRRRYVAMQNSQTPLGMQNLSNFSGHHGNNIKQEIANQNGFGDISMSYIPNQFNSFVSPSNSSSSPFSAPPPIDNVDKVSSIVSMLKDTLERKKTNNQAELGPYSTQEVLGDSGLNQGQGSHVHATFGRFQDVSSMQVNNPSFMQTFQGSYNMDMDHFVTPMSLRTLSREPSQSESSAVATVGFDVYDGLTNPGQTVSENSRRQAENGSKDIRDKTGAKVKEEKKRGNLVRYGSVTSAGSGEKGDPTKKRRVERSRKMAEAKERNLTPTIPSNMQSILKRCENLEKEVRSLKLNLAFMNRKDSEQTKQIEELQNHNDELTNEKERLLEEIERILGDTD